MVCFPKWKRFYTNRELPHHVWTQNYNWEVTGVPAKRRGTSGVEGDSAFPFAWQASDPGGPPFRLSRIRWDWGTAMQLEHLREYLCFAKTLSITKASEELFITQSTLSKHIRALEKEIDAQLVITEGKQMHLTPAGAHLASKAQDIIRGCDAAMERCRELSRKETLVIKAQSIPFQQDAAALRYVEFTQSMAILDERVKVKYAQSSRRDFEQSIAGGSLDVAPVYRYGNAESIAAAYAERGFRAKLMGTDRLGFWCNDSMFPDKTSVPISIIENTPVMMPPNSSAPVYSILRDIERLFGFKVTRNIVGADTPIEYIYASEGSTAYLWPSTFLQGSILGSRPHMKVVNIEDPVYELCVFALAQAEPVDIGKREVLDRFFD